MNRSLSLLLIAALLGAVYVVLQGVSSLLMTGWLVFSHTVLFTAPLQFVFGTIGGLVLAHVLKEMHGWLFAWIVAIALLVAFVLTLPMLLSMASNDAPMEAVLKLLFALFLSHLPYGTFAGTGLVLLFRSLRSSSSSAL